MANKITLATVWLDGCSGCHMSFLDMDAALLDVTDKIDLVYSPLVDNPIVQPVEIAAVPTFSWQRFLSCNLSKTSNGAYTSKILLQAWHDIDFRSLLFHVKAFS